MDVLGLALAWLERARAVLKNKDGYSLSYLQELLFEADTRFPLITSKEVHVRTPLFVYFWFLGCCLFAVLWKLTCACAVVCCSI